MLALEVLSKIPKVTKKCGSSPLSKASSKANLNSSQPLENGTQGGVDWGPPAAPAHAWGGNDSVGGLDWSQPVVKVEDDGLQLDWDDDKEDDEDEDDDDGLTMKKPEAETKDGGLESGNTKLQRDNSQVGIMSLESIRTISNTGMIIRYNDIYIYTYLHNIKDLSILNLPYNRKLFK